MADQEESEGERPWFVLPVLALAVLAVSSAAAVTKLMQDAAPVSSAAWRLQATAIILLPGFVWDWWRLPNGLRKRTLSLHSVAVIAASAMGLALHFGLWVWSLEHTSLPQSLLLVCTPPIILAVLSWLRCQPLSVGETIGIILGVFGTILIAALSRVENEVTFIGDFAAFLAACAFVVYMIAGSHLRVWMPLYIYVFPVTAGASVLLSIACRPADGKPAPGHVSGPFGWISKEFWLPTLFLAIGPGFAGHTGLNAVLKYCNPLIIAMAITLEPVFGSFLGWLLNVSPAPGISTCIGGSFLVVGTIWVNYASGKSKQKSMQSAAASHPIENQDLLDALVKNQEENSESRV